MPELATDAGTLHYEDAGKGEPVLLVHGWSLSSAVLADEVAHLAQARRVIAPDLRGHGRSSAASFALADLAGDLAGLAGHLALERAVLVGWSLGAQVALAALPAIRLRVAGLVLLSGTPRFTTSEGWPHGLPARSVDVLAHRVRRDASAAVARFFDGMFADGELDTEGRARAAALRASIPPPDRECALAGLEILAHEDLRAALPAIDVPVLVLHGERDPICPAAAGRAMAAAIPRARHVEIHGAGHAPFLSRPGAFRDALASFLAVAA